MSRKRNKSEVTNKNEENENEENHMIITDNNIMRSASIPCDNDDSIYIEETIPNSTTTNLFRKNSSIKINAINPKKWPIIRTPTSFTITCCDCNKIFPINSPGNSIRRQNHDINSLYTCVVDCNITNHIIIPNPTSELLNPTFNNITNNDIENCLLTFEPKSIPPNWTLENY